MLLAIVALAEVSALAGGNIVTATVAVTNSVGTTNGQTLTVNGDTRTWVSTVTTPSSQILTNSSAQGSATNMFTAVADAPFSKFALSWAGSTNISLQGAPGLAVTISLSAGWGSVSFTTNVLTAAEVVRVPYTVEPAAGQTNVASGVVAMVGSAQNTNIIPSSALAVSSLVGTDNAQTITGAKTFSGANIYSNASQVISGGTATNLAAISGNLAAVTNGVWRSGILVNPTSTNGVNYGNAFSSPGSGSFSEQFGATAQATALGSMAFGYGSLASSPADTALGELANATGGSSTAIGYASLASGPASVALGASTTATNQNSTAIGTGSRATNQNSTAVGYQAKTTADNQVMLGGSGVDTYVQANLHVLGNAVSLGLSGTNINSGDISYPRYALGSLANGNNAGVQVGTNVFVEVSGPTGAFTINGISGQPNRDGKFLMLLNRTGQNMTIANDSGVDPTAGNRIYCLTGADKSVTGNSAALLIYSGSVSRWIVLSFTQ